MTKAAASVRLCVETAFSGGKSFTEEKQPPPCGCVLKQKLLKKQYYTVTPQPPPCGCVLKQILEPFNEFFPSQPPPCGCVLKRRNAKEDQGGKKAAASVRLCVETL